MSGGGQTPPLQGDGPRPSSKSAPPRWDERTAAAYHDFCQTHDSYRQWALALVDLAEITPGMRVLDLGCGTGAATRALVERHGASVEVWGADGSEPMLAQARRLPALATVTFVHAAAERLTERIDGPFDCVLSNAAFWQFDQAETFAQLSALLRPGGRLVYNLLGQIDRSPQTARPEPPPSAHLAILRAVRRIAADEFGAPSIDPPQRPRPFISDIEPFIGRYGFALVDVRHQRQPVSRDALARWYRIPVFNRMLSPGLSDRARAQILEKVERQVVDGLPDEALSSWMTLVKLEKRASRPGSALG